MVKYEITTPYGNRYLIHDNGDIQRTDMQHEVSGQWKLRGIRNLRCSTLSVDFDHLSEFLDRNPPMLFKNGKPRWTVMDIDHGTYREWGNTEHHGIKSIRKVA